MKKLIPLLFLMVASVLLMAQGKKTRLQPGKFYEAGESIYAPRFGFNGKIPAGWQGSLPRESELFLLQTVTPDVFGEIYVFGRAQGDVQTLKQLWLQGTELSESIRIKAKDPVLKGDMLVSEVIGEGQSINKGNRGYIAARCNPDGPCIIALSIMPKQFYEPVKNTLEQFLQTATFESPNTASPYANLNWNEFLAGKSLVTYAYVEGGSKDTEIHLCADGTFTANIKKTGFMKNQNPQYNGKLSGTWVTKGIGETTNITFTFSSKGNLPPVEIPLTIRDEQVFANDERYFVAQSTKCK
ncbi:MAG: hypothetical protein MUC73_04295 [Cyclobacteriaceae bacterium]|jgi:hypothetical protein|nr:hypothetical protein [Cyclobacteriaceae bacterium]